MSSRFRKAVSSTLAFAMIYSSWPATQAYAACGASASNGSGPPSISATEVSTSQALQVLRRRQDEQQQPIVLASLSQQPPAQQQAAPPPPPPPQQQAAASAAPATQGGGTAPGAAAAPKKAPAAAATSSGDAPKTKKLVKKASPKAVDKPAPAKEKAVVASAAPAPAYRGGSIKDDYVAPPPSPTRGVWVQGYYDYERQSGWTLEGGPKGALTSKEQTAGFIAGADIIRAHGDGQIIVGVLGGYSSSTTKYNDTGFTNENGTPMVRFDAKDTTEGGSVGAYGLYTNGRVSADLLVKVDLLDYKSKDIVSPADCANGLTPYGRENSADLTNVVLAGNVARRYMMSPTTWFEPIIGFRYTHSDYSNIRQFAEQNKQVADFGLSDGDIFRIQGGLRYGFAHPLSAERVWVMTIGGFLYSDVWISGISADYRDVNEGKLRVMGQLTSALAQSNGVTWLLQGEVRGGDDLIGVGVKGGVRYEW